MRTTRVLAAGLLLLMAVALTSPVAGGVEAGTLSLSAVAAGPGDALVVTAAGCSSPSAYREVFVRLLSGTGAASVAVAFGSVEGDGSVTLPIPDWYDPDLPARVEAECNGADGESWTSLFTFPAQALDLLPPTGPPVQVFTVSSSSVEEGQAIHLSGTGCTPAVAGGGDDAIYASLLSGVGTDLVLSDISEILGYAYGPPSADGTWALDLVVNGFDGVHVPVGPALLLVGCGPLLYRPTVVEVTAVNPSVLALEADIVGSEVTIAGEGCDGGRLVVAWILGSEWAEGAEAAGTGLARLGRVGSARRDAVRLRSPRLGPPDRALAELHPTPGTDGSWVATWEIPADTVPYAVVAECGDPVGGGFRYQEVTLDPFFFDAWVDRVSPTASPLGGPVTVHLTGACPDRLVVSLRDGSGSVVATGELTGLDGLGQVDLVAPPAPGTYRMVLACGGGPAMTVRSYEVFDPGAPKSPVVLPPPGPTTGWPSAGPHEHFEGRIGPIWLPAEGSTAPQPPGTMRDSALGVSLPRPPGDFAIRGTTFDLVDADGSSVPLDEAHLHHFVMADLASRNPACPNGTFGLPGEIFAAVGQERSRSSFPDPYGIVVHGADSWAGVYDLMNTGSKDRIVYLTYTFDLQRDVSAIRPLRTYFFSATGCSSFTWLIDGGGRPDEQTQYLTMAADGLLVGGGGHVHSGGEHTELRDDRGRLLCRSELVEGDVPHQHGMSGQRAGGLAGATGRAVDDEPDWWDIPEFYDDDPVIEGITGCGFISRPVVRGERLRFTSRYTNDRPRSGVMGIGLFQVWHGGGPAGPVAQPPPDAPPPDVPQAPAAQPFSRRARFTG